MRHEERGPDTVERSIGTPVLVLGVGNTIMGDDGIGLELLNELESTTAVDPLVEYLDGANGGMELLPVIQDARYLLLLDAIAGDQPGEVRRVDGDQVPRLLAQKLSPHQVGLLDLLASARLLGREPERIIVVGVVPENVDLRVGLTASAAAGVKAAVPVAREALHELLEQARAEQ